MRRPLQQVIITIPDQELPIGNRLFRKLQHSSFHQKNIDIYAFININNFSSKILENYYSHYFSFEFAFENNY